MAMTSKTMKTILFASIIAAMILPFSVMGIADAAPNDNAKKTHLEYVQEGKIVLPGQMGYANPSDLKAIDSDKSINENAAKGIDRSILKIQNGKTILDIDAIEQKIKNKKVPKKLNEGINYPADGYNSIALKHQSDSMTYFNGFWYVPSDPSSYDGDATIFTFNAMQPFAGVIFQPVLQYGNNGPCPNVGANWVMYPYVYTAFGQTRGDCTSVSAGDLIRGTISKSGSTWTIEMQDYDVSGSTDSVQAGYSGSADDSLVALETYGLAENCNTIPGDETFSSMVVSGTNVPNWVDASSSSQQWCGMDVNIVSQSTVQLNNNN